jgi:hypothetical protein
MLRKDPIVCQLYLSQQTKAFDKHLIYIYFAEKEPIYTSGPSSPLSRVQSSRCAGTSQVLALWARSANSHGSDEGAGDVRLHPISYQWETVFA